MEENIIKLEREPRSDDEYGTYAQGPNLQKQAKNRLNQPSIKQKKDS